MLYRVKGALLIGIILTSVISWPRGTAITFFPYTKAGDVAFDYFKKVVAFHPLEQVGGALDVGTLILSLCYTPDGGSNSYNIVILEYGTLL